MPLQWQKAIAIASLFRITAATSCYYPDGSAATDYDYVPCATTQFSSCCIPDEEDLCWSDGLCVWPGNYIYRGACTDPTWKSSSCPNFCKSSNVSSGWDKLNSCGGTTYCCEDASVTNCCSIPTLVFDIGSPSIINNFGAAASTAPPRISTAASASSQPTSTIRPTSAAFTASGIGTGAIVGIIVAVVLFLVLVCVGGTVFLCIRRSQRRNATLSGNLIDMNPSHNVSGESAAPIIPAQGAAWTQSAQSPAGGWEKQSEYFLPHYQKAPIGEKGETLVELQTQPAQPSKEGIAITELP